MKGPARQRGLITIFLSLIMLLLITAFVLTAYTMSTTNLRAVGNQQAREQAIAAANIAIEQEVSSPFSDAPAAVVDYPVDLNDDGTNDYLVSIPTPTCVKAVTATAPSLASVELPGMTTTTSYYTTWEFRATATNAALGTSVTVIQAVRVLLSDTEKDNVCA
jgi:hypothetical protein